MNNKLNKTLILPDINSNCRLKMSKLHETCQGLSARQGGLTVALMKKELEKRNLDTKGLRTDLVARLCNHLKDASAASITESSAKQEYLQERIEEIKTKYKEYLESLPEVTLLGKTYRAPPELIEKIKNKTITRSERKSIYIKSTITIDITDNKNGSKEELNFHIFGNLVDALCEHYNIQKPMKISLDLAPEIKKTSGI